MKWLLCALLVPMALPVLAGDAAFSPDGKLVHVVPGQGAKLWTVNVADGKVTTVDLAKELGADDAVKAIAPGPKGTYWIASRLTVWQWSPTERKLEKHATLKGSEIFDLAYNPAGETILITGEFGEAEPYQTGVRALARGEKEFAEPKLGLTEVVAPVFDREGRFYFRHESDLWVGRAVEGSDDVAFNAFRAAPLGNVLSEGGELGASKIISAIAPTGKGIYVAMSNLVEAELIFLPQPATGKAPGALKDAWKRMTASLQSLSVVPIKGSISAISALCASPDGAQLFFRADEEDGAKKFRLLETKSGKMRTIGDAPKEKE